MSKLKCFLCHKNRHYASQCPEKKKRGKGTGLQVIAIAETQLSELAAKFEDYFSLVSCLSINTIAMSAWYSDSGASFT